MKQVSQRLRDGQLRVLEVPAPQLDDWKVLVRTHASLVSAGTERAKVEVARQSLLGKARRRPDQVRQVVEKVRSDGLKPTIDAVRNRLEALTPLGYCAAGRVEEVGARVSGIGPGELVACGGEEAAHAELLAVPGNFCCSVPDDVDVDSAPSRHSARSRFTASARQMCVSAIESPSSASGSSASSPRESHARRAVR